MVVSVAVVIMTAFTHQNEEFNAHGKCEAVISLFLDMNGGVTNHAIVLVVIIMLVMVDVPILKKSHESLEF